VKYGGGNIKVLECISRDGVGPLHRVEVDISAEQSAKTHILPCYGLVPKEINSGYGVTGYGLGETGPSMQRPKTMKSKRFVSNPGKNTDIRPGQTGGLHAPPL
jgi:hypothetical protein